MEQHDKAKRLAAAEAVARDAGALALDYFRARGDLRVERKGPQDVASHADRAVETLIHDRLLAAFPEDAFFGEEHGVRASGSSSATWVVDPIDGTACFLAGIPSWCVSIACLIDDQIDIGVVYEPCCDCMFSARKGGGAHLDGGAIRVSDATDLTYGSVGVGFSHRVAPDASTKVLETLSAGFGGDDDDDNEHGWFAFDVRHDGDRQGSIELNNEQKGALCTRSLPRRA